MLLFLLLVVFFLLHLGFLWGLLKWIGSVSLRKPTKPTVIICATVLFLLFLTPILGMLAGLGNIRYIFMKVGNVWLGAIIFLLMAVLAVALVTPMVRHWCKAKVLSRRATVICGVIVFSFTAIMLTAGMIHAKDIKVNSYDVNVKAENSGTLKVAFVADLHMGSQVGVSMVKDMAEKINAMSPDLIVIGGDVFNSDFAAIQEPEELKKIFTSMKSTYGTYGVYGNHDVAEVLFGGFAISAKDEAFRDQRMADFLKDCGVKMLEDESMELEAFTLVGRLDAEKSGDGTSNRQSTRELLSNINRDKPVIVVEHEPVELAELEELGADVVLGGHTHNGQFFPLTIPQSFLWQNPCGLLKLGDMSSIVTSGVGFYGPPLRLFTDAEVCEINITYGKTEN